MNELPLKIYGVATCMLCNFVFISCFGYYILLRITAMPVVCFLVCRTLFLSATMNLCDLLALRDDLKHLKKVLYFHENQLVYPVRKQQDRDFQFGYNQILSWLVLCFIACMHNIVEGYMYSSPIHTGQFWNSRILHAMCH